MLNKSFDCVSVCMVVSSDGKLWLKRIADVEGDTIIPFISMSTERKVFDNRDLLYLKENSGLNVGYIGIWEWNARPRDTDPDLDFITIIDKKNEEPLGITLIAGAQKPVDIKKALLDGFSFTDGLSRVLVGYRNGKNYQGVICDKGIMTISNGKATVSSDVAKLPYYEIPKADTISVENTILYKSLSIPTTDKKLIIKGPEEVVRDVFLRRTSWTVLKEKGYQKAQYQVFKEYLQNLPLQTITEEISDIYGCLQEKAREYLNSFLEKCDIEFNDSEVDELLAAIIRKKPELRQKAEELAAKNWKESYSKEIEQAEAKLDSLHTNITLLEDEIVSKQKNLDDTVAALTKAQESAVEKEAFLNGFNNKIQEKINIAKQDVAEFLSSFIIYNSEGAGPHAKKTDLNIYKQATALEESQLEHYDSWGALLELLKEELENAGVDSEYSLELGAFLYSAFLHKYPILLAGPESASIAVAFSAAVEGKLPAELKCPKEYDENVKQLISNDSIVLIKHALLGEWPDYISDLVENKNTFVFIACPYADDLAIEPKGLYNYVIPVITDVLVAHESGSEHYGGLSDNGYRAFEGKNKPESGKKIFDLMGVSKLLEYRYSRLISDKNEMLKINNRDSDYIFMYLPIAKLFGKIDLVVETLINDTKVSKKAREDFLSYFGRPNE